MKQNCTHILRLYVTGIDDDNKEAISLFEKMLKSKLGENYTLETIDILANPDLANNDKIIATPTLIRTLPSPAQKVIVDFNNEKKLLLGMELVLEG